MTAKVLLDTNVLVYIYADSDLRKQAIADVVANTLIGSAQAVVSTQVLAEFFHTATRKIGIAPRIVRERLAQYAVLCGVLIITADVLTIAARAVIEHQLSFWDALLWATALVNHVPYILSEDFQDGIKIEGVRILNPFTPKFDISRLLPA
jgi:predicted nucleic acid-binding protein